MKKLSLRFSALLLALVMLVFSSVSVFADGEDTEEESTAVPEQEYATYAYLYNFENDEVLYEKGDLNLPTYPTSITKIMSGVTAIEELQRQYEAEGEAVKAQYPTFEDYITEGKTVVITEEMLEDVVGNSIGLDPGEKVSASQMLFALLVNSANDAAYVLSYIVSGGVDSFVEKMNDKAHELSMNGTAYTNPTGMHDDGMYTTTADTVKLAKHAYTIPLFMEAVGTPKYVMQSLTSESDYRNIYNRNCLISKCYRSDYYYKNAIGMNAGSTTQGGYSGVFVARNNDGNLTYLCVIMNAESTESEVEGEDNVLHNYTGAIELFDWAFENYSYREVLSGKKVLAELPVTLSATVDYVTLMPLSGVTVYLPNDVDIENDIKLSINTEESVPAPITKGQVLGSVKVVYNNRELGRVDLIATADVSRSEFLYTVERIKSFTSGGFFIATAVAAVIFTLGYILLTARLRMRRLRRGTPRGFRK